MNSRLCGSFSESKLKIGVLENRLLGNRITFSPLGQLVSEKDNSDSNYTVYLTIRGLKIVYSCHYYEYFFLSKPSSDRSRMETSTECSRVISLPECHEEVVKLERQVRDCVWEQDPRLNVRN